MAGLSRRGCHQESRALSLGCCSVQERYGDEEIHRVLDVTSSQGTKTNQRTTIGSNEVPRAARRAAHQFELVM